MEILELIYAAIQLCGCFLEVMAVSTSAGAGAAGYKAAKTAKEQKRALERGDPPPQDNRYWFVFGVLCCAAAILIVLVLYKWIRHVFD